MEKCSSIIHKDIFF